MAQASCWQPLFINKATFSTIHCSQSSVHVTGPRTRHVNACREWKARHKNVVMSHFSWFSLRLGYKQAMAVRWDFIRVSRLSRCCCVRFRKMERCCMCCPLYGSIAVNVTCLWYCSNTSHNLCYFKISYSLSIKWQFYKYCIKVLHCVKLAYPFFFAICHCVYRM